jgi:uncharacterized protein (DUF58 family)
MIKMYLPSRFYVVLSLVALMFVPAYIYPGWFRVAEVVGLFFLILFGVSYWRLFFQNNGLKVERVFPEIVSIGEANLVRITVKNEDLRPYRVQLFPELPADYSGNPFVEFEIRGKEEREEMFTYRPLSRGKTYFGKVRLCVSVFPHIVLRRIDYGKEEEIRVYPSVVQMRKYSLRVAGIKLVQRSWDAGGIDEEFDEIKNFVQGDDRRRINWRASGKSGQLMVNRFISEQTRDFYCVLDISRPMLREEAGICILEQAINAALVLSNVVMERMERIGLILVGRKAVYRLPPDTGMRHLRRFLEALYDINGEEDEADYRDLSDLIHLKVRRKSTFVWIAHEERRGAWKVDKKHICLPAFIKTGDSENLISEVLRTYFRGLVR